MGSAQDEAGPSGSRRVARGNMYAMSRGTFAGSSVRSVAGHMERIPGLYREAH